MACTEVEATQFLYGYFIRIKIASADVETTMELRVFLSSNEKRTKKKINEMVEILILTFCRCTVVCTLFHSSFVSGIVKNFGFSFYS